MYILGDSIELKNQKDSFSKYIYECERERDTFKEHRVNPRDLQSVFYVKPSFNNVRMKLQSGLFVIFGLKYQELNDQLIVDKNYFRETIMGIKPNGPIVIDKNSKDEILGELKFLCGISFSSLFGDLKATVDEPKDDLFTNFLKSYDSKTK